MSSKPAKSHSPAPAWSISARLVFLFTLAATALLLVATVTIYFALVRHMDEVDTDFLREKLRSLRDDLVEDGLQRDMLQHVVGASRNATEPFTYHVRILTDSGESLAETPGMSNLLPRERFGIPAHSGEANPPVAELRSTDGRPFLALAAGVESDAASENRWIVQLAQDRSKDRAFLRDFRALLIVLLVLGAGAAAGLGLFVARRGLRPLDKMTASVARIEASHLHERIGSDDWPKELSALAGAFDEMLRHLEDAFARLSQFSADLAHELRTPVCNLRGEAEVALSRPRSPEE
ncbi:MAG: HAMP domain-containing protein, partial [Verrucomicrobiota bacterium]|nr:HAMP domain-containing protein [Verrucomicrobiota bacterium]